MPLSGGFDTTLVCERRPSRALAVFTACAYGGAVLGAAVYLAASTALMCALAGAALAALDYCRLARTGRLYWSGDGLWRIGDPEGAPLALDGATWSTPWFILLVLRGPGGRTRIPLARDALDAVTWRRLRARLRVSGAAAMRAPGVQ